MMTWFDTLRTALEAMLTHRMRSALTVLGIQIGIAPVILTVGLGIGQHHQDTFLTAVGPVGATSTQLTQGLTAGRRIVLADPGPADSHQYHHWPGRPENRQRPRRHDGVIGSAKEARSSTW